MINDWKKENDPYSKWRRRGRGGGGGGVLVDSTNLCYSLYYRLQSWKHVDWVMNGLLINRSIRTSSFRQTNRCFYTFDFRESPHRA